MALYFPPIDGLDELRLEVAEAQATLGRVKRRIGRRRLREDIAVAALAALGATMVTAAASIALDPPAPKAPVVAPASEVDHSWTPLDMERPSFFYKVPPNE
jgi:hypothetical protein